MKLIFLIVCRCEIKDRQTFELPVTRPNYMKLSEIFEGSTEDKPMQYRTWCKMMLTKL